LGARALAPTDVSVYLLAQRPMSSATLLLILVFSPSPDEPTNAAMERAAREVLGASAAVHLERVPEPASDAAAIERAGQAGNVAEILWDGRESARMHCYIAADRRWVDRSIGFGASDRDEERGRLLGFALGSMFGDAAASSDQTSDDQADPGTAVGIEVVPVVPAGPARHSEADQPALAPVPQPPSVPAHRSLSFAVQVASPGADGETSPELGAAAAFGWGFAPRLALRFGVGARMGEIPAAQANLRRLSGSVGVAWELLQPSSVFELALRADAVGGWVQVAHLSSDDVQRVHHHRWVGGGDAVFDVGYRLSALSSIGAGLGLEALAGNTHVYTHGREVATVPMWHGVAELQFRTQF
jgi:hypothetical protein